MCKDCTICSDGSDGRSSALMALMALVALMALMALMALRTQVLDCANPSVGDFLSDGCAGGLPQELWPTSPPVCGWGTWGGTWGFASQPVGRGWQLTLCLPVSVAGWWHVLDQGHLTLSTPCLWQAACQHHAHMHN